MALFSSANTRTKTVTPVVVCEQLLQLLGLYKAHMARLAEENGLTVPQLHALHTIAEGNNTMGQVAKVLHCDASNVTGIIDRLKSLSLVTREEDPQDRRVKTVQLTADGERLLKLVIGELPTRLNCDKLGVQELEQMHATVHKLINT